MPCNGYQTDRNLRIDNWHLIVFPKRPKTQSPHAPISNSRLQHAPIPHRPNRADRKSYPIFDQTDQSVGPYKTIARCVHMHIRLPPGNILSITCFTIVLKPIDTARPRISLTFSPLREIITIRIRRENIAPALPHTYRAGTYFKSSPTHFPQPILTIWVR